MVRGIGVPSIRPGRKDDDPFGCIDLRCGDAHAIGFNSGAEKIIDEGLKVGILKIRNLDCPLAYDGSPKFRNFKYTSHILIVLVDFGFPNPKCQRGNEKFISLRNNRNQFVEALFKLNVANGIL